MEFISETYLSNFPSISNKILSMKVTRREKIFIHFQNSKYRSQLEQIKTINQTIKIL